MSGSARNPPLTICVLTYGDHADLVRRCIESIRAHTERGLYRLVVGANAPGLATQRFLQELRREGAIDLLYSSRRNINKCPMMRRMFGQVTTPYICWFDDDSYLTEPGGLARYLEWARQSPAHTMMWGRQALCGHPRTFIDIDDVVGFVRSASWYRGLPPPSWEPGGKGEFDFAGRGTGDGRWEFILGGFWLIRTRAVRALDWPDRRLIKLGDDVLLGEALRQRGWCFENTGSWGVSIDQASRRGEVGGLARPQSRQKRASPTMKGAGIG